MQLQQWQEIDDYQLILVPEELLQVWLATSSFLSCLCFISLRNVLILLSGILSTLKDFQGIQRLHVVGPQAQRSHSELHSHWHPSQCRQQDRTLQMCFMSQYHTSIKANQKAPTDFHRGDFYFSAPQEAFSQLVSFVVFFFLLALNQAKAVSHYFYILQMLNTAYIAAIIILQNYTICYYIIAVSIQPQHWF